MYKLILLCLCLTGCATTQPVVTAPCPSPTIPPSPHYPVADLKQGDSPAAVAKAYVATVDLQNSYIEQLKHILEGYS